MRVLQVVTLLSPDGAYGGPARVALNQSVELAKRGHAVTVAAVTRGYRVPPTELDGVSLKLFHARTLVPRTGFAGIGSLAMVRWFLADCTAFDIVHIHLARELAVLPIAAIARQQRIPYALQTHGMIVPSNHPLAGPLDTLWTRKVLRDAGAVFHLTPLELRQLGEVARGPLRCVPLPNGVPTYAPVVTSSGTPEVLFAARLHRRKRPLAFVEMAHTLLAAGVDARFTLIGPDEGEGAAVQAAIGAEPRISWEGALAPAKMPGRLASAAVYVLPAVNEPYPMSVLEALSVGLPVVVSDDCGLAPLITRTNCGIVAQPTVSALAAAVGNIVTNPALGTDMGARGRSAANAEHGMSIIANRLVEVYTQIVGDGR